MTGWALKKPLSEQACVDGVLFGNETAGCQQAERESPESRSGETSQTGEGWGSGIPDR